jgi:hypothetical protein
MLPVAAGGSVVYGVHSEEGRFPGLFAYDARTRLLPAPSEWIAHEIAAIAPDGQPRRLRGDTVPRPRPLSPGNDPT